MVGELLNKILETSAPVSDTVEVTVVEGVKLRFKILIDMEERIRIENEVTRWAKQMSKQISEGAVLPNWKDVATSNAGILAQAKMLAMLSLDEEFQNELAWLTLAKRAAPVFAGTIAALDAAAANKTSEFAVFVDEKKDSS
jgi:hypothetical protein